MNLKTTYCSFTSAQSFLDGQGHLRRRPLHSFEEAIQEKGFISYYTCPSMPKLFYLAGLAPVKTRRVDGTFLLLRISTIQPAGCKEETSDALCFRLLAQIWVGMSVTGWVFGVSGRFTDVNSLRFVWFIEGLFFICSYSSAIKEFTIPTSHKKVLRKLWKNAERKDFIRPEDVKKLVFLE